MISLAVNLCQLASSSSAHPPPCSNKVCKRDGNKRGGVHPALSPSPQAGGEEKGCSLQSFQLAAHIAQQTPIDASPILTALISRSTQLPPAQTRRLDCFAASWPTSCKHPLGHSIPSPRVVVNQCRQRRVRHLDCALRHSCIGTRLQAGKRNSVRGWSGAGSNQARLCTCALMHACGMF